MAILVTGGAGFIGSNFVLGWLAASDETVINLDRLTYAGNRRNLASLDGDARHVFVEGDICDLPLVSQLLREHQIRAVINFAAETHVDRSIMLMEDFVQTNIVGTSRLLQAARQHWVSLEHKKRLDFRFVQISTDEIYGSLGANDPPVAEGQVFAPSSPYAASKAAADHLVRVCHLTYGLPVLTTCCSNNYGPFQYPEKMMPLMIHHALAGMDLPVYGDGMQVRDWLYVKDHCRAIRMVLEKGRPGSTYHVGGGNEQRNLDVVMAICSLLDEYVPRPDGKPYSTQISFVEDRLAHDRRYAMDASRLRQELGWAPEENFETGIKKTVRWYLENADWFATVTGDAFRQWVATQYRK